MGRRAGTRPGSPAAPVARRAFRKNRVVAGCRRGREGPGTAVGALSDEAVRGT